MYYAYIIENTVNYTYYVGITKNPHERWLRHKSNARNEDKRNSYLHCAIHKYGEDNFTFEVIKEFEKLQECEQFEIDTITFFNDNEVNTYNIHSGGQMGCNMQNHPNYDQWKQKVTDNAIGNSTNLQAKEVWKAKLREAREGRTPALGMKHSKENKQLFKQVSDDYWSTQDTYVKDAKEILKLSHQKAKEQFGISTTHYYRLKKRFATNDSKRI